MLFTSLEFIFIFLPIVLVVFIIFGGSQPRHFRLWWLVAGSIVFYAYWDLKSLPVLLFSITANLLIGRWIRTGRTIKLQQVALATGIVFNVCLLTYFKYVSVAGQTINNFLGVSLPLPEAFLPLGISFYTFTQIAWLTDIFRGRKVDFDPGRYGLFVTFFPHLIAGPIIHHSEMMPQFERRLGKRSRSRVWLGLAAGSALFVIGLCKKLLIADRLGAIAGPVFASAEANAPLGSISAWTAALAYTLQLYFDFSGYSDMALGIAKMFGIRLPLNFNSPYKALSIVDYWRGCHMTLSRFLRDYIYFPLGGSAFGHLRQYRNLMLTMLIGGLWHGAAWTYVVWGFLQGLYLIVYHAWRRTSTRERAVAFFPRYIYVVSAWGLTFGAVLFGLVFFRADSIKAACNMLSAMGHLGAQQGNHSLYDAAFVLAALLMCVTLPNSQQIMGRYYPALGFEKTRAIIQWRPSMLWAVLVAIAAATAILNTSHITPFLYYQY